MEEELKRFADNLIEQMNDIQQVMKETSAQLKWSHKQALNLRDEHTRLQAAIPSRQKPDAGTFGGEWNKFGQEFVMEIQSHKQEALQIESFAARSVIYDPLECIRRMFHTTAFQKSQEFNEASADYMKSLKKLEEFIAEAKSTQ